MAARMLANMASDVQSWDMAELQWAHRPCLVHFEYTSSAAAHERAAAARFTT